ncbi:MAG: hypothetical protein QOJ34_2925 [Pseudonocardiales bacterium]|jgi:hypothetical protein|nr:hypothetical protein [Pseudonocardiales bacterium]
MDQTERSTRRASRYRVPRSRGALSGFLLLLLGAWAALVPMIGPYFDVAYTPNPGDAWHWTGGRGLYEVLPGGIVFLGGLLLIISASRVMGLLGGWLAVAGGTWLLIGPSLAPALTVALGTPDPAGGDRHRALDALLVFYGVGAAAVFLAAFALGRLAVVSVRDVQAAERRAAEEQAAATPPATTYPAAPPAAPPAAEPVDEGERVDAGRHSASAPPSPTSPTSPTSPPSPTSPTWRDQQQ